MFSFKTLIFLLIFHVIICENQNENMQGDNSFILYTDVKPTNRFVSCITPLHRKYYPLTSADPAILI